jgi:streptomycin 6-kinase
MHLPPQFIEKVHRIFGDEGRQWLPELPAIAARCREKWDLPRGEICPHLSMNYIEFTTAPSGDPLALKIGVPHAELFTEMEALRLYAGRKAARLLDADRNLGAILMQRLTPGTMLWQLGDNRKETEIAASIVAELTAPVPSQHDLPTFAQWIARAFHSTRTEWDPEERMPRDLLVRAEQAFAEVTRSADDVLLHGDLHHENILLDERDGWLAIDPKGAIGPRCLEVGRYLQNQLPGGLPLQTRIAMIRERIAIFSAALDYSPRTIVAAFLIDTILSHCWSFEDGELSDGWHHSIDLAQAICPTFGL